MKILVPLGIVVLLCSVGVSLAKEDLKLKAALQDDAVAEGWIYEDLAGATTKAKKTGKPLLVCFSCVP